jgi:hypothetical protein
MNLSFAALDVETTQEKRPRRERSPAARGSLIAGRPPLLVTPREPSKARETARCGRRDHRAMTADDRERRLRSLLLAPAPYVRLDAPLALQAAVWREVGDELLPAGRF